ncbi:MAG: hypothetical protein JWM20_163 [Patescibacteria group bacterium]|nr:hypothetical protein [Patescibacteria group bacterium]
MKKLSIILFLLVTATFFTGCKKNSSWNVIVDRDYRMIISKSNDQSVDILRSMFGGETSQAVFRLNSDKTGTLSFGSQSSGSTNVTIVTNVYFSNGSYYCETKGGTSYQIGTSGFTPVYTFSWSRPTDETLRFTFDVDPATYNQDFGQMLLNLSATTYDVYRTNGCVICSNEAVTIRNKYAYFDLVIMPL